MFRWIKKKCQRKKIELFRPEQLVDIQEAEFHIYEEIIDLDFMKEVPGIPAHCQCWLQRDIGRSYTCMCPRKPEEPIANVKRSKSLSNTGSRKLRMDISKRPLPKLPTELECQDDAASDSSSGYDSNSVSSLTLEYDVDMLEKLEELYLDDSVLNSMCQPFPLHNTTSLPPKSSTPRPEFNSLPRTSLPYSPIDNSLYRNSRIRNHSLVPDSRQTGSFKENSLVGNSRSLNSNTENSYKRNNVSLNITKDNSLLRSNRTITINHAYEPNESGSIIWSSESIYL